MSMEAKKENKDYLALLSIYTGKDPVEILDEILDAQRAKDHDTLETIYLLMGKMWPPKRPAQKKTEPAQPKKKGGRPKKTVASFVNDIAKEVEEAETTAKMSKDEFVEYFSKKGAAHEPD